MDPGAAGGSAGGDSAGPQALGVDRLRPDRHDVADASPAGGKDPEDPLHELGRLSGPRRSFHDERVVEVLGDGIPGWLVGEDHVLGAMCHVLGANVLRATCDATCCVRCYVLRAVLCAICHLPSREGG